MAYFKDYVRSTSWLQTVTTASINLVDKNCKISTGIQAFDSEEYGEVTPTEIFQQTTSALQGGAH